MHAAVYYFGFAAVMAGIIPIVPKMLNLRIWVLNKLHLKGLANWHRRAATPIIITVRMIFAVVSIILIWLGVQAL
ncbi:MAG: hypothetical protein R3F48_11165 [Candidatus Zixiibacteriota bacterium]